LQGSTEALDVGQHGSTRPMMDEPQGWVLPAIPAHKLGGKWRRRVEMTKTSGS
jgi:hypothetical protein